MRGFLTILKAHTLVLLLLCFLVFFAACEGRTSMDEPIKVRDGDAPWLKHRYRSEEKGEWKIETWLWVSGFSVINPIDVNFRLTPIDGKRRDIPKVKIRLKIMEAEGQKAWEAEVHPIFKDCAAMPPRWEVIYDNGIHGSKTKFPPDNVCWEAKTDDPFETDGLRGKKNRFPIGDYLLSQEIFVENGPHFHFKSIEINVHDGRKYKKK